MDAVPKDAELLDRAQDAHDAATQALYDRLANFVSSHWPEEVRQAAVEALREALRIDVAGARDRAACLLALYEAYCKPICVFDSSKAFLTEEARRQLFGPQPCMPCIAEPYTSESFTAIP